MAAEEGSKALVVACIPALKEERVHARESGVLIRKTVEVEIPGSCQYCGFVNLKIWGTRTDGVLRVEVRCMRCGKPLFKVENDEAWNKT